MKVNLEKISQKISSEGSAPQNKKCSDESDPMDSISKELADLRKVVMEMKDKHF